LLSYYVVAPVVIGCNQAAIQQGETTMSNGQKPSHYAYLVKNYEVDGKEKSFWTRIGTAWPHADNAGFDVTLDVVPLDGRIVIRTPRERD
jgi:hypothetical protein